MRQVNVDSLLTEYEQMVSGNIKSRSDTLDKGNGNAAADKGSAPPTTADTPDLPTPPTKTTTMPGITPDTSFSYGILTDSQTLTTATIPAPHTYGTRPMQYQLWRDSWVLGALLFSFILFVFIINRTRNQFVLHVKNFLYTPQSSETPFVKDIAFRPLSVVLVTLLLSVLLGIVAYVYSQCNYDLFLSIIPPHALLFAYMGCFLSYFLAKRMVYGFVNWVFFEKPQRWLWNDACCFILAVECLFAFPIALTLTCSDIRMEQIITALCVVVVFAKMLLAYKCYSIFFPKFYCLLHFFVYLCALEIVPIVALWQVWERMTGNLAIIQY